MIMPIPNKKHATRLRTNGTVGFCGLLEFSTDHTVVNGSGVFIE